MSSSIGVGLADRRAPRLVDIDVAGRAGAGPAALGLDARHGVADRRFHHRGAGLDVDDVGFAGVTHEFNFGHARS